MQPALIHVSILLVLTLILLFLIRIYYFIRPDPLAPGDIVIVRNPHWKKEMMNMVTEVMNVHSSKIIQIRGIRTTVNIERKWVQKINVMKGSSIKVPEEPVGHPDRLGNQAVFREIPLKWLSYNRPPVANSN